MSKYLLVTRWNNETKVIEKSLHFDKISEAKEYAKEHNFDKTYPNYVIAKIPKNAADLTKLIINEETQKIEVSSQIHI